MSEIFNFKRFGTYFLYDLKQMWRKHSRPAIMIGFSIAIFYILWVLFGLVFNQTWNAPSIELRVVMFTVAFTILELYQAKTYGFLTEKKAGSAWLMVPASRAEKFVSMLLMTLVVIPLLFFLVFFAADGILSLLDPTYGKSLIGSAAELSVRFKEGLAMISSESPFVISVGAVIFLSVVGFFCNFEYFLLCGICFKKNKIGWGLVIIFVASTLLSILSAFSIPPIVRNMPAEMDPERAVRAAVGLMNAFEVFTCLLAVGLGWGIWYRIKTLQH